MWRVGSLLGGVACMIAAGWIGYSYRAGDTLFEPILAFLGLFGAWAFADRQFFEWSMSPLIGRTSFSVKIKNV